MTNFKVMLLGTVAVGLTLGATSGVMAGEVEKSVTLKGHVARMIGTLDDGGSAQLQHQDSTRSGSRIYIGGSAVSESLTIGAMSQFRVDGTQNSNPSAIQAGSVNAVHSYVYVKNAMGTLSLGDLTTAGDTKQLGGSSFSGAASLGADADTVPFGGGFTVKGSNGSNEENDPAVVNGTDDFAYDAGSGLLYKSPVFNGFALSLSADGGTAEGGLGESVGTSITYAGDFDGVAVKAHGNYAHVGADSVVYDAQWNVGMGVEVGSGINFAAGYGELQMSGTSLLAPTAYFLEAGYDTKAITDMGETSIALQYSNQEETDLDTGEYNHVALNIEQDLSAYGTYIYGGIGVQEYKTSTTNYEDITTTWLGLKVTF